MSTNNGEERDLTVNGEEETTETTAVAKDEKTETPTEAKRNWIVRFFLWALSHGLGVVVGLLMGAVNFILMGLTALIMDNMVFLLIFMVILGSSEGWLYRRPALKGKPGMRWVFWLSGFGITIGMIAGLIFTALPS